MSRALSGKMAETHQKTSPIDPAALFDARLFDIRAAIAAEAGFTWPPVTGEHSEVPPVLMTLATVGADGFPRTRNVMVSRTSADGRIWFHTDSRSEKCRHLSRDPRVSLTVLAPDRSTQITVIGEASRAQPEEEARSFAARVRYLQLLAWLNTEDLAQRSAEQRHQIWAEFDAAHSDLGSQPPATWVGFAIVPREYLFWSADREGPSQRLSFARADATSDGDVTSDGDAWIIEILPG